MMNIIKSFKKTLVVAAIAGMALISSKAQAGTWDYDQTDLVVSITQTGGSNELLVNLGEFSTITLGLQGNLAADLTAAFGAGFASDATIQWGVYGSFANAFGTLNGYAAKTIFATTVSGAPALLESAAQGTPASAIKATYTAASLSGGTSESFAKGSALHAQTDPGSFSSGIVSTKPFNYANLGGTLGGFADVLDLYQLNNSGANGPGTLLTTVFFDSAGNLFVGAASLPDAASTLFLLGAMGIVVALLRKKALVA